MKDLPRSPLAPERAPDMPAIEGVRLGAARVFGRYGARDDVMVMVLPQDASAAGVFTRSRCPSAPVDWCRQALARNGGRARAVVVNAGNANAFTGRAGIDTVEVTSRAVADAVGCDPDAVLVASTGVIGEPLDPAPLVAAMPTLVEDATENGWNAGAGAILTTDTFPKLATRTVEIGGMPVRLNGIAKGSGMIAPDMATMLAFVATDAAIAPDVLADALRRATQTTFNAITVDSDTSTSDTLIAVAAGSSGVAVEGTQAIAVFEEALTDLLRDLALQTVRDGEGASKLIGVTVTGAEDARAAKAIAMAIANSPLVKTAVAGEDANWGRVVMAVGKAGERAERDALSISFNGLRVARDGCRDPDYSEAQASDAMRRDEIAIAVDVGVGNGEATVWGCDLTKQYVAINGDYRS